MQFSENKSIYLQICDYMAEKITAKEWKEEDKIPSVRELAVTLEVNANTVVRSYEYLSDLQIIYTKRGLGYFVASKGYTLAKKYLKEEFLNEMLPIIFQRMMVLDIDIHDIENKFQQYLTKNKK